MPRLLLLALLALPLAACDSDDDDVRQTATATLAAPADTTDGRHRGGPGLPQDGDDLRMDVTVNGLAANSTHGFHIHETGSCARGDHDDDGFPEVAGAAGGHYDPYSTMDHGAPDDDVDDKHAGDFGNITADASGTATATFTTDIVSLSGSRPIEGRAVMVHSNRDRPGERPGRHVGRPDRLRRDLGRRRLRRRRPGRLATGGRRGQAPARTPSGTAPAATEVAAGVLRGAALHGAEERLSPR